MVGVSLHLLSYLKTCLCNHTIFQLQGTQTVHKALIPSKMGGKVPRMGGTAGPTGLRAGQEQEQRLQPRRVTGSPAEDHTLRSEVF